MENKPTQPCIYDLTHCLQQAFKKKVLNKSSRFLWVICLIVFINDHTAARTVPYQPVDDNEVLQVLPRRLFDLDPRLDYLRLHLAKRSDNLKLALAVAKRYVALANKQSDPRYYGYAQTALSPWWSLSAPPIEVLMVRATILQNRKQLNAALAELDTLLSRQPDHVAANLNRALILKEQGLYSEARKACAILQSHSDNVTFQICNSSIDKLDGHLQRAYQTLKQLLPATLFGGPGMRQWVYAELATAAWQLGDVIQAEQYFIDALAIAIPDPNLLSRYADLLLAGQHYEQLMQQLDSSLQNEKLLLRYSIAAKAIAKTSMLDTNTTLLKSRFKAARLRGDKLHLRDETRFYLSLQNDAALALKLAKLNWQIHKEPLDMELYLLAALAAGDSQAAQHVIAWIKQHQLEDQRLKPLITQLEQQ